MNNLANQVIGTCKNLVQKHGSEIALVGKIAISTLIPGGNVIADILEHTCDAIKDKQNEFEQKDRFAHLENYIISRLGDDSKRFLEIVNLLDHKMTEVLSQMVEAKQEMNVSTEDLSKLLIAKLAKSPELMMLKEKLGFIGADIKLIQNQNQKILELFTELKGDILETIKEQIKIELYYSPVNQIDGLNLNDAKLYLSIDHMFIHSISIGDLIEAKKHLEKLINLNPNSSKTKNNQALLALLEKQFEKSEKLLIEASKQDPTHQYLNQARNLASKTISDIKERKNINLVLEVGNILGAKHWQLISKIGEGGMGAVWLANNRLNQKGALKILLSGHQEQGLVNRFQREIETLVNINHNGIVKIIDWGEDQIHHIWYMVMEYIEGESLATHLLRNGPIHQEMILKLLEEISKILVICEEKGIVHRDIKPANIMLKDKDPCKPILIDFGIAKQNQDHYLKTNHIILTEAYAAPEQKLGEYSHQSDLYALARTIIECSLPKTIPLISVANPSRYVPKSVWQYIEPLLDDKEHRGDAKTLLSKLSTQKKENETKKIVLMNISFNMVHCKAGSFMMGTDELNPSLNKLWDRSRPKHQVQITKDFWIGDTQVTQELWETVMGWNPSVFRGSSKLPVENITWYDCLDFCNHLSKLNHLELAYSLSNIEKDGNHIKLADVEWKRDANGYRLPTEAEWEYSAKANTNFIYSGSNLIHHVAWCKTHEQSKTHKVKNKDANTWGIYDMSGNVWEWCNDEYDEKAYQNRVNFDNPVVWKNGFCKRVLRGGSALDKEISCRVDSRSSREADKAGQFRGLRIVRYDL